MIKEAGCGYCGKADDADELVKNIELFMNSDEKELMGLNARAFYEAYFEQQKFMDTIEDNFLGYA